MKSNRWLTPAGLVAALLLTGVMIDTAHAQLPQCQPPVGGCPATGCTFGGGNCPDGTPYIATIQTAVAFSPCQPGVVNNCPNPLRQVANCTQTGYQGNFMNLCDVPVCTLTFFTGGC